MGTGLKPCTTFDGGYYLKGYTAGDSDMYVEHPSATTESAFGETFTTPNRVLELVAAIFYIRKTGNPRGQLRAELYATTASGACYIPTGSALATSDTVDMYIVGTSYELIYFNFSTTYKMSANTRYAIVVTMYSVDSADASNCIEVAYGPITTLFTGNEVHYASSAWSCTTSDLDTIFYICVKSDWKNPTASPVTGSTSSDGVQVIEPNTMIKIDPATGHETGIKDHIKIKAIWFELSADSASGVGWSWGDVHGGYGGKMFIKSTSGLAAFNLIEANINCQSPMRRGLYLRNPDQVTVTYTIIFEYL